MTATCPPAKCQYRLGRNYFINLTGSAFQDVETGQDCSNGLLLLTDTAGLVDVDNPGLGAYLSTNDRVKRINSFEEAITHFSPCTPIYDDLRTFFLLTPGRGSRPTSIYVGYVDTVGETWIEGYDAVMSCPVCAWTLALPQYLNDYSPFADTTDMKDLVVHVRTVNKQFIPVPTWQASLILTDPFEVTSEAAVVAALDVETGYVLSSYYCTEKRDGSCDVILNPPFGDPEHDPDIPEGDPLLENRYSNSALIVAAILSSYSYSRDPDYLWTAYLKPFNFRNTSTESGQFVDELTQLPIIVKENQVTNATGIDGLNGGEFIDGATRSVGLFAPTEDGLTYVESLNVNRRRFHDAWYKERVINEEIERKGVSFFSQKHAVSISDSETRALASIINITMSRFVAQGLINPADYDWENNGYPDAIYSGNGYVIRVKPISELTQQQITQRSGYAIQVCFIVNEPVHRANISICDTIVTLGA